MEKRVAELIMRNRGKIFIVFVLLTLFFAFGLYRLQITPNLSEMLPGLHPYIKLHKTFVEQFGGANLMVMELKTKEGDLFKYENLVSIKKATDFLQFHPYVRRALVNSIAQRKMKVVRGYGGGTIDVSALMWPIVPKNKPELEAMRGNIYNNDLYDGVLVSTDGTATLIFAELKEDVTDYAGFFKWLEGTVIAELQKENPNIEVHMAGLPILFGWIDSYQQKMLYFMAGSIVIMLFFLALAFRNYRGTFAPVCLALISAVWGLGFMGWLRFSLNPLYLVIPFFVMAICVSHSLQLMRRYLEGYAALGDNKAAVKITIQDLFLPALASIVTDAVGFLVLVACRIPVIMKLGIVTCFWVLGIVFIVFVFGAIVLSYLPPPRRREMRTFGGSWLDRFNVRLAGWLMGKRGMVTVLGVAVLLVVTSAYLSTKLVVGDIYPGSPILWPDSQYNRDVKEINARFDNAGTDTLNVVIDGSESSLETPEVYKLMEDYERFIKRAMPKEVGGTSSLVSVVKKLQLELHEGDPKWDCIPSSYREAGTIIKLYRSAGDPGDFERYSDDWFHHGNILVFFKNHTGATVKQAIEKSREWIAQHFKDREGADTGVLKDITIDQSVKPFVKVEKVSFKLACGLMGLLYAINEEVAYSQTVTLIAILFIVWVFVSFTFRSFVAGFILLASLITANLVAFAYMAVNHIGIDLNVLPVSAVGVGVGVDYGLYLLTRIRDEYEIHRDLKQAVTTGMGTSGRAILFTGIILSFSVLIWFWSPLKFQAEMGFLLGFVLLFNMIGSLFFVPALVFAVKPRFITKVAE
jgi:hypothetical protein